jgi:hypothetical protein
MKKFALITYAIFYLILISFPIFAVPQPHNVAGTIFLKNGGFAIGGIPIRINNTVNGAHTISRTNGIGPPFIDASYSATINGSDTDLVMVTAWNATHYGFNSSPLAPTTTYINVVLNTTRPSETNVTIMFPPNNQKYNISDYFNVTVEVAILGSSGQTCSASIFFNNNKVLMIKPTDSQTHSLGGIPLGTSVSTTWNVSANLTGASNITVKGSCSSDGINLENASIDKAYNITIQDIQKPIIGLISPLNNSLVTLGLGPIYFWYNVSDLSPIKNCSLIINGKINKTNGTITKVIPQYFDVLLDNNTYNWSVNCTDNSTGYNTGASITFNLTIIPNKAPVVTNMALIDQIDLNIGTTKTVFCNATISDENNISDISVINSSLYHTSVKGIAIDDNNNHYTNSSCINVSKSKFEVNVSCGFEVYYYADNGSWSCNISAVDLEGASGFYNKSTRVNELLAVDISPDFINYEELEAGDFSLADFKVNITNLGNIDFNISVKSFGQREGDNISMNCTKGNISSLYEKYALKPGKVYSDMINITNASALIANLTLPQRTDDITHRNDRNFTYWKMGIPYGVQGSCSGFLNFLSVPL